MHPRKGNVSCQGLRVLLAWWLVFSGIASIVGDSSSFSFEVTHRFSEKARSELRERHGDEFQDWPPQRTPEYYDMLFKRDLHRHHGRILAAAGKSLLASSAGNITYLNENDGLQYTYIEIGTPSQQFFVALDTGSDYLWLPCTPCISCAPSSSPLYGPLINGTLSRYDPTQSSTYTEVRCDNPYCDLGSTCSLGTDQCPYQIQYVSPATSAGFLVQDVMYFIPQKGGAKTSTNIVFGCGRNQTGGFLQGGSVPDGLMGLGMQNISVPSILAHANLVRDSFSMCFEPATGSGRLVFGDRGAPHAPSTAILALTPYPFYWVGLHQVLVGGVPAYTSVPVLFDTGTTFTYLSSTAYATVTTTINAQIPYQRISPLQVFEYCYLPPDVNNVVFPTIVLQFTGGAELTIVQPFLGFVDTAGNLAGICLGIINSKSDTSIIGHNFMLNHSITFDRLAKKISWIQTSCDDYQTYTGDNSTSASDPSPPPSVAHTPKTAPSPTANILPARSAATNLLPPLSIPLFFALLLSAHLDITFQRQS